jgi:hypothetical protein
MEKYGLEKCMDAILLGSIPARNGGAFTKCLNRLPTIGGLGSIIRRIPFPCGISIAAADISCASSPWSEPPGAGSEAGVSIFELRNGKFEFEDSDGGKRTGRQMLVNKAGVRRSHIVRICSLKSSVIPSQTTSHIDCSQRSFGLLKPRHSPRLASRNCTRALT